MVQMCKIPGPWLKSGFLLEQNCDVTLPWLRFSGMNGPPAVEAESEGVRAPESACVPGCACVQESACVPESACVQEGEIRSTARVWKKYSCKNTNWFSRFIPHLNFQPIGLFAHQVNLKHLRIIYLLWIALWDKPPSPQSRVQRVQQTHTHQHQHSCYCFHNWNNSNLKKIKVQHSSKTGL